MFDLINYLTTEKHKGIIVWLCNIGAEKYWNKQSTGVVDKQEDMVVSHIEEMNLMLCRKQDIIILREKPDEDYLHNLKEYGLQIPTILVPEDSDPAKSISELTLKDEKIQRALKKLAEQNDEVYFVPYAVTSFDEEIAQNCNLKLIGANAKINAKINDKILGREIAQKLQFPVCEGKVCTCAEEIREEYYRLTDKKSKFKKVIIKEPFGASGKGLYVIEDKERFEATLRLISRLAKNNAESRWIVEGWYEKRADVNYQIYISEEGKVKVFSIKQQLLKDTVYIGSKMPPDLEEEELEQYRVFGEMIGKYLFNIGYRGVAGVDSFITTDNTIIPIIEINGRFTLSTYISFLNDICEKNKILSRYFKVITEGGIGYKALTELLETSDILFKNASKEGVIIYTSGTLPNRKLDGQKGYSGRIFALIIAPDDEKLEAYNRKLEELVEKL